MKSGLNNLHRTLAGRAVAVALAGLALVACGNPIGRSKLDHPLATGFSLAIPFSAGTSSGYSFGNAASVELVGGVARLKLADQVDDENSSSEFGAATATANGVSWDASGFLRLNTATNRAELDGSWAPQWSSLVGYWKLNADFNGTVGGNMTASGAGAAISAASYKVGAGSASLDGASYAALAASSTYGFANQTFTVAYWVKSTTAGGYMVSNGAVGMGWGIQDPSSLSVLFKNCINSQIFAGTSISVADGKWHHVAVVLHTDTAAEAGNTAQFYVDGRAVTTSMTYPGSGAYCDPTNQRALAIGARHVPAGPVTYFTGSIDDVAIWSVGLTAAEIKIIYARQAAKYAGQFTSRAMDAFTAQSWTSFAATTTLPFAKEIPGSSGSESSASYASQTANLMSGIAGLWHLSEAAGSATVADSSGNGNNGSVAAGVTLGTLGIIGDGASMSGAANSYIQLANAAAISPGAGDFSVGVWFKTNSAGNQWLYKDYGVTNVDYFAIYTNPDSTLGTRFRDGAGNAITLASAATVTNGSWHFALAARTGNKLTLYLDGTQVATQTAVLGTIDTSAGPVPSIGGDTANRLNGTIDEVALWSRAVTDGSGGTPNEVLELYRRGANRLKYQVRTCASSDCSDQEALSGKGWKGPDNSNLSYFSELHNNSAVNSAGNPTGSVKTTPLSLQFSTFTAAGTGLSVSSRQYFQYRAIFESDDENSLCTYGGGAASCSPELSAVSIGPSHYDSSSPTITSLASIGARYNSLASFTESGASCAGGLRYALSGNGTGFFYWNGSTWAGSTDYATANDAAVIQAQVASFPSVAGVGTIQVRTYLKSDGSTPCQLDELQIRGEAY